MNQYVDTSAHNAALRDLWRDWIASSEWPTALGKSWPTQYPNMPRGLPLFVGMNPSFSDKRDAVARLVAAKELDSAKRGAELVAHEERALGFTDSSRPYRYYAKFDNVVRGLATSHRSDFPGTTPKARVHPSPAWNHVDTLAIRWQKQAELKGALGINDDGVSSSRYANRNLKITLSLIDAICPCIVVVVNALASTMLRKLLGSEFSWDEAAGCDVRCAGGRDVPWLFSSMLTGQRALDNHSVERLSWHMRHILRTRG